MLWAVGAASGDRRTPGEVPDPASDPDEPRGLFGRELSPRASGRKAETPAKVGETRGSPEFLDQTGRGPASRKVSRGRSGKGKESAGLPREPESFAARSLLSYRLREPLTLAKRGRVLRSWACICECNHGHDRAYAVCGERRRQPGGGDEPGRTPRSDRSPCGVLSLGLFGAGAAAEGPTATVTATTKPSRTGPGMVSGFAGGMRPCPGERACRSAPWSRAGNAAEG
jgi:hypothetical protein